MKKSKLYRKTVDFTGVFDNYELTKCVLDAGGFIPIVGEHMDYLCVGRDCDVVRVKKLREKGTIIINEKELRNLAEPAPVGVGKSPAFRVNLSRELFDERTGSWDHLKWVQTIHADQCRCVADPIMNIEYRFKVSKHEDIDIQRICDEASDECQVVQVKSSNVLVLIREVAVKKIFFHGEFAIGGNDITHLFTKYYKDRETKGIMFKVDCLYNSIQYRSPSGWLVMVTADFIPEAEIQKMLNFKRTLEVKVRTSSKSGF